MKISNDIFDMLPYPHQCVLKVYGTKTDDGYILTTGQPASDSAQEVVSQPSGSNSMALASPSEKADSEGFSSQLLTKARRGMLPTTQPSAGQAHTTKKRTADMKKNEKVELCREKTQP